MARDCEAAGLAVDRRITNSEGATLSTHRGVRVYGNTHGFLAGYPSSSHSISCVLLAQDEARHAARLLVHGGARADRTGRPRTGRARAPASAPWRAWARDSSPRARRRCCSRPTWRAASSGTWFRRCAVPASTASRRSCWMPPANSCCRRSCRCSERPHLRRALASSPFDAEGVTTRDRELVRDGVLQGYVLGSYSARKLGLHTTGNAGGIHNLLVESNAGLLSREQMLRQLGSRPVRHRDDGAGRQWRHRRLFPRRQRFLGRGRRDRLSRCTR